MTDYPAAEPRSEDCASLAELPSGSPLESLEAALGVIPPRPSLALPRWLGPLAVCSLVALLPWIVYLGLTLPRRAHADHYDLAWLGFDCAMWAVLAALAYCALRRRPATGPVAAVAATMLVVDAWFDVVTTSSRDQFVVSVVLAVFGELPLAIICAWSAVNAERIRARAYHRLRLRWERAVRIARAADGHLGAAGGAVRIARAADGHPGAAGGNDLSPPPAVPPTQ